tara:strand:- start:1986 stop:3107 length:1122 start_codon:yes stop_codon:yes gene_type:complete
MSQDSEELDQITEANLSGEAGSRAMEQALQSSFVILKLVIAVLVIYLVFSNTYSVDQDKSGAIELRFGQVQTTDPVEVYKPGIRFAWPYPIEEKVEIKRESPLRSNAAWHAPIGRIEIGESPGDRPVDAASDGYVITSDDKILHIQAEMTYRVTDPERFKFAFAEATDVLQYILDNGITSSASDFNFSDILTNPTRFAEAVKRRVSNLVRNYSLGVEVTRINVSGKDVKLPFMVQKAYDSFNSVSAQREEALSSAKSEAEAIYRAINTDNGSTGGSSLNALSGDVATIRNQANNQAQAMRASVDSLANRFKEIVEKYPDPVSRRRYMEQLYFESMERISENDDIKIYLISKSGKLNPTKLRLLINQPPPEVEK